MDTVPAFLVVAAVVILAPGPDFALTLRNTLVGGRPSGIATAWGVAIGQVIWAFAASLGLAALLATSEPLFRAVQLAGAGYLCYLGAKSLWSTFRRVPTDGHVYPVSSRHVGLRQGLVSNLGNPKMAAFFTGLLPQFAGADGGFVAFMAFGWCSAR